LVQAEAQHEWEEEAAHREHQRNTAVSHAQLQRDQGNAEIALLVNMRTAGRSWTDVLTRTLQAIEAGQTVDMDAFDADIKEVGKDVSLAHYGYPGPRQDYLSARAQDEVIERLRTATEVVRSEALKTLDAATPGQRTEARNCLELVQRARNGLKTQILERLAEVHRRLESSPSNGYASTCIDMEELHGPDDIDGSPQPRVIFRTTPLDPPLRADAHFGRVLGVERRADGTWSVKVRVRYRALLDQIRFFEPVNTDAYPFPPRAAILPVVVAWVPGDVVIPIEGDEYSGVQVTYQSE
jgi:hypothetical protein